MVEYIVSYLTIYLNYEIILQSMAGKSKKKSIKCCSKPLEFILQEGLSWQVYIPEIATCSTCSSYYEKKKGKDFSYKEILGDRYVCTLDGEIIRMETVAHPIWDGPFPMSGSGRCKYETVPYCPKHEEKPNYDGKPIKIKFKDSGLYKKMAERL